MRLYWHEDLFYRHFIEIRSKNGLSYAPGSWFSRKDAVCKLFVTTTQPDKYIGGEKSHRPGKERWFYRRELKMKRQAT
jgi:hypothetical protein